MKTILLFLVALQFTTPCLARTKMFKNHKVWVLEIGKTLKKKDRKKKKKYDLKLCSAKAKKAKKHVPLPFESCMIARGWTINMRYAGQFGLR